MSVSWHICQYVEPNEDRQKSLFVWYCPLDFGAVYWDQRKQSCTGHWSRCGCALWRRAATHIDSSRGRGSWCQAGPRSSTASGREHPENHCHGWNWWACAWSKRQEHRRTNLGELQAIDLLSCWPFFLVEQVGHNIKIYMFVLGRVHTFILMWYRTPLSTSWRLKRGSRNLRWELKEFALRDTKSDLPYLTVTPLTLTRRLERQLAKEDVSPDLYCASHWAELQISHLFLQHFFAANI